MNWTTKYNNGFSLIEVILGVSIITIIGIFVGLSVTQFSSTRNTILSETKKIYLAEEGYEIIRLLRDETWTNISSLSLDTTYFLDISTTTLAISGTPEIINNDYTRSFSLQYAYRDGSNDIVASSTPGATADVDMRKVFIYVSDGKSTTTYKALLANLPTP
ncbi:MAG: prepilin-type N-terminal cleavage/methylation domain-containing protein [Candidatus Nomurabacteria bacterium]|nr:MAG: prepilin-type N-terminal cleavage/methylation domain-containing protein [Candidatus Nomurabacteria bacterium]